MVNQWLLMLGLTQVNRKQPLLLVMTQPRMVRQRSKEGIQPTHPGRVHGRIRRTVTVRVNPEVPPRRMKATRENHAKRGAGPGTHRRSVKSQVNERGRDQTVNGVRHDLNGGTPPARGRHNPIDMMTTGAPLARVTMTAEKEDLPM